MLLSLFAFNFWQCLEHHVEVEEISNEKNVLQPD